MKTGRLLRTARYSISGYWISWIDCQRHMLAPVPTLPLRATPLACQVVDGPWPETNG